MTKNTKKLLGLVGALAVLGGAYGAIVWINQHNEEKAAEQSKAEKEANTFYLSQMEEPVSISYTNSYGTFAFSYDTENETWSYDSDEHFPVTQSYLTSISSDLKSFTAERKLEEVQDDLSVYGLDNPSCTITARGSDDTEVTIQIGSLNSYNSDYYAKLEGSDDIYTIASSYVSDISNDISALQEKESFPTITSTSITDVQLVKRRHLRLIWKRKLHKNRQPRKRRPKTHPRKQKREVKAANQKAKCQKKTTKAVIRYYRRRINRRGINRTKWLM